MSRALSVDRAMWHERFTSCVKRNRIRLPSIKSSNLTTFLAMLLILTRWARPKWKHVFILMAFKLQYPYVVQPEWKLRDKFFQIWLLR